MTTPTDTPQADLPPVAPSGEIVARAGTYYRVTRYIMVLVLFVYGLMSIYDGFYRYPKENKEDTDKGLENVRHPSLDVPFNKTFGVVLPPLSIVLLIHVLRKSRGEIRFDGKMIYAPGHPPVGLENIVSVDQRLWDRKGIAYVDYDLGSDKGRITLDDFIYDRPPIDAMHKAITEFILPPETSASAETSTQGEASS
jgi:hypothetical protein